MNEFERIKELYDKNKILSSEDIEILFEIIRMLDYRVKQQNEWYKNLEEKNKQKDIITNLYKTMYNDIEKDYIRKDKIREIIKQLEKEQEENRRNLSLGIELLSNTIIDKFSNKIMINLGIREYLENIIKENKENG